jgi:hypothetical protein
MISSFIVSILLWKKVSSAMAVAGAGDGVWADVVDWSRSWICRLCVVKGDREGRGKVVGEIVMA